MKKVVLCVLLAAAAAGAFSDAYTDGLKKRYELRNKDYYVKGMEPVSKKQIDEAPKADSFPDRDFMLREAEILVNSLPYNERDMTHDNVINCQDYTMMFYMKWVTGGYGKDLCEIVWNKNEDTGKMNHLFIRIRQSVGSPWVCIEPWPYKHHDYHDPESILIERAWGSDYDPEWNLYGTTEKWLEMYFEKKHSYIHI